MAEPAKTIWIEKFFEVEIPDFDSSKFKKFRDFLPGEDYGTFELPLQRETDRYNDIARDAKIDVDFYKDDDNVFNVDITPEVLDKRCYFLLGENEERHEDEFDSINGKFSKVVFCIDIEVPVPNLNPPDTTLADKLKNMCIGDPSNKFVIKCQSVTIETLKLILAACSPVFAAMFESKVNSMKITDFEAKVVQKMVEFCENDKIASFEGCEEGLFKIAHKYQIAELMEYASHQMARTATEDNRIRRLHMIAQISDVELFEKCVSKF